MSVKHTTVTKDGHTREVTWDSKTGESTRQSKSAETHVDNGKHSTLVGAKYEARKDIARGEREKGDTHYRGR